MNIKVLYGGCSVMVLTKRLGLQACVCFRASCASDKAIIHSGQALAPPSQPFKLFFGPVRTYSTTLLPQLTSREIGYSACFEDLLTYG